MIGRIAAGAAGNKTRGGGDWGATAKVEDAPRPDRTFPDLISFARMSGAGK